MESRGQAVRIVRGPRIAAHRIWAGIAVLAWIACGCSQSEQPQPIAETFEAALVDTSADFSHLRYASGELSLNDRCPVRRDRLNPKVRPLFVNGKPTGFC